MSDNIETRARSDSSDIAMRKIFIGGLSYSTDEEKLRKYFRTFGSVQDAVVMKDPVSKRSRGFGFITFYDINAVDQVLANEPHTIDARKVEAKRAVPRAEMRDIIPPPPMMKVAPSTPQNGLKPPSPQSSPQMTPLKSSNNGSPGENIMMTSDRDRALHDDYAYNKIFVGGLHYDTRDPDFRAYFERYGKVISAEVMFNRETHKSRGFGFIVFEKEESAIKVCNEKEHTIDGKVVEVKRAIPRSKIGNNSMSPPSTIPTSNSSNNLLHHTPTSASRLFGAETMTFSSEGRSDVRSRSLSGSSLLSSPPPSQNSTTMVLTSPGILSLKPPQMNLSNSQLPPSGIKRVPTPSSSSLASLSAGVPASNSYAAALKLGGSNEDHHHLQQPASLRSNPTSSTDLFLQHSTSNSNLLGSGIDSFQMSLNNNTSTSNLQGLLLQSSSRDYQDIIGRQARAFSEPIKFDNSFAFSQDIFDLNAIKYGTTSNSNTNNTNTTNTGGGFGGSHPTVAGLSSINTTLSADHMSDSNGAERALFSPGRVSSGGAGIGSISWLGSGSPANKFDAILDASSHTTATTTEFTRGRAHSIGPTTIASSSRSPGFLGYPNFGTFSHDSGNNTGILMESLHSPPSQSPDRQQYGYPPTASLENKSLMFSTPLRGLPPLGHHTPATSSLKQRSPAPTSEWNDLLTTTATTQTAATSNSNNSDNDNSNLIVGSLLGVLGENQSIEGSNKGLEETVGVISTDTSGSRILSLSKSNSNDLFPQRRHSHPAVFSNAELYDASRMNEFVNTAAVNAGLWSSGSNDQRVDR